MTYQKKEVEEKIGNARQLTSLIIEPIADYTEDEE